MPELIYLNDDLDATIDRILSDNELSDCGLTRTKVSKTLKSFQGDEIACSVFFKKYAVRDDHGKVIELTLGDSKDRWANYIATGEDQFPKKYKKELS